MRLPFGKYKGKDLRNVPHAYLDWVLTLNNVSPELRDGIRQLLGYTVVKYPSVERSLRPEKGKKKMTPEQKQQRKQIDPETWLQRTENAEDYQTALNSPSTYEMAQAAERLRQRWEAR